MLGFALVVLDPPIVLFLLALSYAVSGPVFTLVRRRQRRRRRRRETASEEQAGGDQE
jgi:CDP-diacylglycerol---serine O-phosphatidyltransferase